MTKQSCFDSLNFLDDASEIDLASDSDMVTVIPPDTVICVIFGMAVDGFVADVNDEKLESVLDFELDDGGVGEIVLCPFLIFVIVDTGLDWE